MFRKLQSKAQHKLEVAIDLVTDVTRMDNQAAGGDDPTRGSDLKISPADVKEMMKHFKTFDRNNDRTLDVSEIGTALRVMGQNPTQKQLQMIAKEADVDKNGRIDGKEFIKLLTKHMQSKEDVEKELREAFAAFDRNKDGKVDQTELIKMLQVCGDPLTKEEADELMNKIDTNKDGYIDINEFVAFLCKDGSQNKSSTKRLK